MKRHPPISRRTFLKLTATAAAAAALAGCTSRENATPATVTAKSESPIKIPPSATSGINPTETMPGGATPAEAGSTETATSTPEPTPSPAYLAVVHGLDPAAITRAAIEALGGMASFVSAGYDVIIKPNICTDYNPPEYASTTNPTVVATLVSLCL